MNADPRPDLLSLVPTELESVLSDHFEAREQPGFRVKQVLAWIFERDAPTFEAMSNLPVTEREALATAFDLREPEEDTVAVSADRTVKHLWRFPDGELVESVLIPSRDRLTLCISSQAGCAMGCTFCATGWAGFRRQLTAGEIVAQFRASRRWARENDYAEISNVVYMGMGEPMANRKPVFDSLTLLNHGYGVGARRITVSTVGHVPGILEMARRPEQFRLALSLHAPTSALREELIPLERRFPLPEIMDALQEFQDAGGKRITFEYTMIRGVNDAVALAAPLAELAYRVRAFVNLIPFNPIPYQAWEASTPQTLRHFEEILTARGVEVAVRVPRGRDIDAACGQLRASALVQIDDTADRD